MNRIIVLLLLIASSLYGCGDDSSKSSKEGLDPEIEGNLIVNFEPDETSLIKNPCTGWSIYCDGYIPNPKAYFEKMERVGALKYATHLYVRLAWALYEPQEGEYAWDNNANFINLIEEAKRRGLKLAFRVYYDNKDYPYPVTPRYVMDAGAEGYMSNTNILTPYADDPVFHEKLEKFIKAMSAKYNDPDIVDFVDGFNIGIWGEGFGGTYKNSANKDDVLYRLTKTYA